MDTMERMSEIQALLEQGEWAEAAAKLRSLYEAICRGEPVPTTGVQNLHLSPPIVTAVAISRVNSIIQCVSDPEDPFGKFTPVWNMPVTLHPATDDWMRGARHGRITAVLPGGILCRVKNEHPSIPSKVFVKYDLRQGY